MSLRDSYAAFLANPSSGALADNAALHYITTLTSIHDATAIIKHLAVQEKLLKKKQQKMLAAVEGSHAVSVDVDTTLEFQNGGGAYLPGLDDNFVADRTVTFPMVRRRPTACIARERPTDTGRYTRCTLTRRARSRRCASTGTRARCSSK
jgi:hypothetical protein